MDATDLDEILTTHQLECEESIASFKRDLQKMRTGRASTNLLSGIMVDYYGTKTHLSHLGQVTSPEARQLVVQVYDSSAIESVEKAIRSADLGFNPSRDGATLRINVPPLTEQSRREIVKMLHKMAEEIRVSIRNHRRDANDQIKKGEKEGTFSKDDAKRSLESVQEQTDAQIKQVDVLLAAKEAECMEV